MNTHANGRENASQLEERLANEGLFFPSASSAHGFIVISSDYIFVVEEDRPDTADGFHYQQFITEHVQEFTVETGEPETQYDQHPEAEKADGGTKKPTTHIRVWMASNAFDFYADADPRTVASAFVTKSIGTNNTTEN